MIKKLIKFGRASIFQLGRVVTLSMVMTTWNHVYADKGDKDLSKLAVQGGYVLTHEHPTYGMAFGGNYAFAGAAGNYKNGVMEKGYTDLCGGCKILGECDHGEVKGNLTGFSGGLGGDMGNHSNHMGPKHNSNSHLRYSTEWIKEAFAPTQPEFQDTRMKIMVAFAVENEAMCEQLYYANKGNGGPGGNGYPCSTGDSLKSLERQIKSLKAWVSDNSTWMEIAYTAADTRRIANSNKLAIILGIESEYSFGAEGRKFDPVNRLNRYYDMGVRTFYLAHKINSRLSGADIFHRKDTTAGKAIRATQAISGCFYYDDNIGDFPLINDLGHKFCDNNCGDNYFKGNKLLGLSDKCSSKFSEISEVNMADYVLTRGADTFNGFKIYPQPPGFSDPGGSHMDGKIERNNLGLSNDGERVVRAAMMKGMIVNIDHISSKSREQIYKISSKDFNNYPLNALHNNPNEMLVGKKGGENSTPFPHEYDFDKNERKFIYNTGGFFGVRVGPFDSKDYPASGVEINCPKTITETAKILAKLLDEGLNVGYSLDYATVTQGVHSRTFRNCGRELGKDLLHQYGHHITEGLSHIGMMKNWHKELETVGLKDSYLKKLRNDGPEAFIQMWENSEARAGAGQQIPRDLSQIPGSVEKSECSEDSDCAANQFCTAGILDLKKNACKSKKSHNAACTDKRQCASNRCSWGFCADANECLSNSDCSSNQYCGDPVSGKQSCKALKNRGKACTKAEQCSTGRCSWGFCADADECHSNSDCSSNQFCGDPISGKQSCKALKDRGTACTKAEQCSTGRCSWGNCADADECRSNSDCSSNQFCGDPISGKQSCKALKNHGQTCTKAEQCSTGRCSWGICADADDCRSNNDCSTNQFCGDPVSGKQKCKVLKAHGKSCTKAEQCATGRCSWGFCADADECRSNSDCSSNQFCGDPIAGKRKCKALKSKGKACTKRSQCSSGKCSFLKCK